jgi:hypothetical protein
VAASILGEDDLFFALERAGAADLLEVGLQGAPLATGIELLGRDHRGGAHRGLLGLLRRPALVLLLSLQLVVSS